MQLKHCVKSVQIQSFFWSVFFCIRTEYRKIWTRKNSAFGHFSCSEILEKSLKHPPLSLKINHKNLENTTYSLTRIMPLTSFCTPWKHQSFSDPFAGYTQHKKWSFPLRISSANLKKSLMENFIFCAVSKRQSSYIKKKNEKKKKKKEEKSNK